jgi:hypothetical protein
MVTGKFRDPNVDDDHRRRQHMDKYQEAFIDAAMLQGDLVSGSGKTMLKVIKAIYEKRMGDLAAADPQCQALEEILAALGHVATGAPEQFYRALLKHLGPEIAVPFDPQSELYEATAKG